VSLTREERKARDCLEGHRPFATRPALQPHRRASGAADCYCSTLASSACRWAVGWATARTWWKWSLERDTRSLTSLLEIWQDKAPALTSKTGCSSLGVIWQRLVCYQKAVGTRSGSAGCGGWESNVHGQSLSGIAKARSIRVYIATRAHWNGGMLPDAAGSMRPFL
jgi:hypothetical protein